MARRRLRPGRIRQLLFTCSFISLIWQIPWRCWMETGLLWWRSDLIHTGRYRCRLKMRGTQKLLLLCRLPSKLITLYKKKTQLKKPKLWMLSWPVFLVQHISYCWRCLNLQKPGKWKWMCNVISLKFWMALKVSDCIIINVGLHK